MSGFSGRGRGPPGDSGRGRGGGNGRGDGRGDGGRGRGGGGSGGGGGRGIKHMGEIPAVLALLRSSGMSDSDILKVVAPPISDRDRKDRIRDIALPSHENWRMATPLGAQVSGPSHTVKSNHFIVDAARLPSRFFHYNIQLYPFNNQLRAFATASTSDKEDSRLMTALMKKLRQKHPEWDIDRHGFAYDGRSNLYTSNEVILSERNSSNQPSVSEILHLTNADGTESTKRYQLTMSLVAVVSTGDIRNVDTTALTILDQTLVTFAKLNITEESAEWFTYGSNVFRSRGEQMAICNNSYLAVRGYYAGLKSCLAGLMLVCDMTVGSFLNGGEMVNVLWQIGGFNSLNDLVRQCDSREGLHPQVLKAINSELKNVKVNVRHLGHWRKCVALGPPANHPDSSFPLPTGQRVTVADYFKMMCKDKNKAISQKYIKFLTTGKLQFPSLPTINVGNASRPILIPPELLIVPAGQCRSNRSSEMTSQIIRYSAVKPQERFDFLESSHSLVNVIKSDPTASSFGVSSVSNSGSTVPAILLPPAKLLYGNNDVVDPGLQGSWKVEGRRCQAAPGGTTTTFGILMVGQRAPHPQWADIVKDFVVQLQNNSKAFGLNLTLGGPPVNSKPISAELSAKCLQMKSLNAKLIVVILCDDSYGIVKKEADLLGIITQCCKWKNIDRPPSGYVHALVNKMVTKLGGATHSLASRLPQKTPVPSSYQQPPASISWIFDKPSMLVGIDVSHPDRHSDANSVAAVVASMDGRLSQYAAHISSQNATVEMVQSLTESMTVLLNSFKRRNQGKMPENIVIYRDGVSDAQFNAVLDTELPAVRNALDLMGYMNVKISIVICQKGHHTRLAYQTSAGEHVNICPGLVIDATGGNRSISSAILNEFYLNSHIAIQGTAKPCKYTLIYDEIGFKLSELELLTYWTTYTYARCTKSVSYATPAYYAHWASKRGNYLVSAGASPTDLLDISALWSGKDVQSSMFFI